MQEKIEDKYANNKKCRKVRGQCNLKYSILKDITVIFHNESNYDFEEQHSCLGVNTEKYIIFSVSIEKKVIRICRNGEEITKAITYRLQFIDSARFMERSLSNLANILAERIHDKSKCKYGRDNKKCKTCRIRYKD